MIHSFDEFEFDADKLELRRAGRPLKADTLLLRTLAVLVRRPGELITKREILAEVWSGRATSDNALSVSMARLRKLLGHERQGRPVVVNVHGRGYRFVRPVTPRDATLRPPLAAPMLGRVGTPFVGRARVLSRIREALEEAHSGTGGLCVLSGEPGIGKTRAVEVAAREAAAAGLPVAWGYCREVGDTPALWPLAQLVRALVGRGAVDPQDARVRKVAPELERLLPELADDPGRSAAPGCSSDVPADKHRIFDAIARVLSLSAERAPALLVLDDLHRADPATSEFLRYFVDEIASTRLVLAVTLQKIDAPHLDYVLGHRNTQRLSLSALSEAEVASYLTALLGETSPALARAVFEKSEGNAFFMTELARQLRESEHTDLESLQLPRAALDLVRQRVSRLDEPARNALGHAAVIGRHFSLPVLQAITGLDAPSLMLILDRALASELVAPQPEATTEFAFAHEWLRAVLYEVLPPSLRRQCHLRVAEALEQRAAAGETVPAADLAYHFRAALPAGDPKKTVHYCRRAAADAARVYAYADGARYLQHALKALDLVEDGNPRLRLRLLLSQALYARGYCAPDFDALIREVIASARAQRSGVPLAHAALLLDPYRGFPGTGDARAVLEEALALMPEAELGNRAAVLARLASIPPLAYDRDAAHAQLAHARRLADIADEPLGKYNVRMAELYLTGGQPDTGARETALSSMREIEQLCRSPGLSMTVQTVLFEAHRAIASLQNGELSLMQAALDRGESRCRKLDSDLRWLFARFRALASINTGQQIEGVSALRALMHRVPPGTPFASELFCTFDACVVLNEPASVPQALLLERLKPEPSDPPNIWALKLRALAAAGELERARSALAERPPHSLAALPYDRDYLGTLGALTRAALSLNARPYLEALVPLLTPHTQRFAANIAFLCEGSVTQLLGLAALRLGKPDEGLERLAAAAIECERAGLHACAAQARMELALCRSSG